MSLQFFNTLTRGVQPFLPLFPDRRTAAGRTRVGLYCCGPTVYDFGHIGNFRTFVFGDLVRRHLEFRGYAVEHVLNITDVEDKIIRRVRELRTTLREFTGKYTDAFLADLDVLLCRRPQQLPRATEFIPQIIDLIRRLENRRIAYRTPDGSVYFSIDKYRGCGCKYGQLVNLKFDDQRPTGRVADDEYDKDHAADFALWKARVADDGDVFWPSPWGEGRPGWHIECSAMSMALLGPSFDLHLGGEDLVFPHHEDEIAQSEGAALQAPEQPFVRCWLHGAHLLVEGKKMSKSLGNYFTVRDLLARGFNGREIRVLLLSAHYRETFNFTLDGLAGARAQLARIDECLEKLRVLAGAPPLEAATGTGTSGAWVQEFAAALDDDLNVSRGWAVVFDWIRETNRALAGGELSSSQAAAALGAWAAVDGVLGLGAKISVHAPPEIVAWAQERMVAKKAKDFARADALRLQVKAAGWLIEDTAQGPKLRPE